MSWRVLGHRTTLGRFTVRHKHGMDAEQYRCRVRAIAVPPSQVCSLVTVVHSPRAAPSERPAPCGRAACKCPIAEATQSKAPSSPAVQPSGYVSIQQIQHERMQLAISMGPPIVRNYPVN